MAKNRVHGGPTNRGDLTPPPSAVDEAVAEPEQTSSAAGSATAPDPEPAEVEDPVEVPEAPPGNASRQAWAEYVAAIGGYVDDDDTRNDLIAKAEEIWAEEEEE